VAQFARRRAVAHLEGAAVVGERLNWIADKLLPASWRGPDGGLLSAGFRAMPSSPQHVIDMRGDLLDALQGSKYDLFSYESSHYSPSLDVPTPSLFDKKPFDDPLLRSARTDYLSTASPGAYPPSFQQKWKPPYRRALPFTYDEYGPALERGLRGTSRDPEMPYMGAHLPFPGTPGSTPPPSPSGPHNRGGDPARPGYGYLPNSLDPQGLTLNSNPWGR